MFLFAFSQSFHAHSLERRIIGRILSNFLNNHVRTIYEQLDLPFFHLQVVLLKVNLELVSCAKMMINMVVITQNLVLFPTLVQGLSKLTISISYVSHKNYHMPMCIKFLSLLFLEDSSHNSALYLLQFHFVQHPN